MADNDDRRENTLPVTSEVGSEGGSFADPTAQVPTFEGDIHRVPGRGGAASSATQAVRSDDLKGGGSRVTAGEGVVRYPTEPPHPPSAREGRRMSGVDWKTGLVGAAAGAAVALAVSTLRGRAQAREVSDEDRETVVVAITPPLDV